MYSAPFLLFVNSVKTRNRFHPRPRPRRVLSILAAKLSRKHSATLPRRMMAMARTYSYARLAMERMMQMVKIHFETSKGMMNSAGSICDDHLLKARSWYAVKISTA